MKILEQTIKNEILSTLKFTEPLHQDMLDIVETTKFSQLTNEDMKIKAGENECIFLLGKQIYYTKDFLKLPPIYKACYFFIEWQYQSYYLSSKNINANSATLLLQEENFNTEYITYSSLGLLIALGLISASAYDYRYTNGLDNFIDNFNRMKGDFLSAYNTNLNEKQLKEQLQNCYHYFSTQLIFGDRQHLENFQNTLPQVTKEKAKTYLHRLIVEQDTNLGKVEFILGVEPYIYFNATIPIAKDISKYRALTYKNTQIPKLLYSTETGILYSSRTPQYRQFRKQTETVRHMLPM